MHKYQIGQKVRLVDSRNSAGRNQVGHIFAIAEHSGSDRGGQIYLLDNGWDAWESQLVPVDGEQVFERFMERVMKPVKLDEPVTA